MIGEFKIGLTDEDRRIVRAHEMTHDFFESMGYDVLAEKIGLSKFEFEALLFKEPMTVLRLQRMSSDELQANVNAQEKVELIEATRYELQTQNVLGLVFDGAVSPIAQLKVQTMLDELSWSIQQVKQSLGESHPNIDKLETKVRQVDFMSAVFGSTVANDALTQKVQALLNEEPALQRIVAERLEAAGSPSKPSHT